MFETFAEDYGEANAAAAYYQAAWIEYETKSASRGPHSRCSRLVQDRSTYADVFMKFSFPWEICLDAVCELARRISS